MGAAREIEEIDKKVLHSKKPTTIRNQKIVNKDGAVHYLNLTKVLLNHELPLEQREILGIGVDVTEYVDMESRLGELNILLKNGMEKERDDKESAQAELKEKDALLLQQSKMALMGEMVGMIAHQWKQPLSVISMVAQNISDYLEFGGDKEMLEMTEEEILKQVTYMSETINSFRNFFKPSKLKIPFLVHKNIQETLAIMEHGFDSKGISIEVECDEDLLVYGYPNEFKQVLMTLLSNSKDALLQKRVRKPCVKISTSKKDGFISILLEDNGGGIDEEILPTRLFDAYVSTKGDDGTGIGLMIAKKIVTGMGGSIEAYNNEEGACFLVKIELYSEMMEIKRQQMKQEMVIVGIGASAGGLEALQELVAKLPSDKGISYIITQHLSPTYKSMMVELLAKGTNKSVLEAKDGISVEGDTIYITPPNKNIRLDGDIIRLFTPSGEAFMPKPSVDIFFESLSYSKKTHAVGIILSGTGSDGSRGMQCIKAEGGITMAQEPTTAKYNGMPLAAINAQSVDMILPPFQIAEELPEIVAHIREGRGQSIGTDSSYMEKILMRINQAKNVDFSEYKPTTISRRVHRRMAALKMNNASEYVEYLYRNEDEPDNLFKDIIIGVTEFFRDDDSFVEFGKHLEDIIVKKGVGGSLRIWDVGCATGEETYSVAILVLEILKKHNLHNRLTVQIFATDINSSATRLAREGVYPASALASMPQDILKTYFIAENEFFRVSKELRDVVIFSQHDIIKDPPFLRLDAVVCRNLLIYFSQRLQDRIFPLFHYTLNNGGVLFLGKSEAIGRFENLFTTLSKDKKVYRREFSLKKDIPSIGLHKKSSFSLEDKSATESKEKSLEEYVIEGIGAYFMPMSIVVNEGMDIIYVREKNPYIGFPTGSTTMNIYKCLDEELVVELRTLLHECQKDILPKAGVFQHIQKRDAGDVSVRMTVIPLLYGKNRNRIYIINFQEESQDIFVEIEPSETMKSGGHEQAKKLESELKRTKVHLQAVIEELETTNEELQSLNEELQSSNEELQSSNEELETTNEELQSTNEELQTAYAELKAVSDEREVQRDLAEKRLEDSMDIKNLLQEVLDSSLSAVMAFDSIRDEDRKIVDFVWTLVNRSAEELVGKSQDELLGKRLLEEMPGNRSAGLFAEYVQVVESGEPFIGERYYDNDGLRAWLYISAVKHKDGFVVTFLDITKQRSIENERMLFEKSRRGTILELLENLSHQWRQPLNNISMVAQNIEDGYEDGTLNLEEIQSKTECIVSTTMELSNLITMFSSVYSEDKDAGEVTQIEACVQKAIDITTKIFDSLAIQYSISVEPDLTVVAHKSDIVEVLISLFINIADAVRRKKIVSPVVSIEAYKDNGNILLSVKDNCGGIDKELLPKIFDPYSTTKFKSFNKGLGLFIVKNIVEIKLRGDIRARNYKDGAEFTIRLPNE
eukprot:TRINITY_DN6209_c0_g2_i1.p1 TRINITY_DN6209_c0_g2~~TRINITY_DN6209_c0_g2_i1.p1  ORF type:complete len:1660 (-),score=180.87 TRINITY_DN6209_c0_g2_i1:216-4502(-)